MDRPQRKYTWYRVHAHHYTVTVTFNTNGGDPIADREYQADDFLYGQAPNTGLPTPTRAGRFTFEGWYSNAQLTQKVGDTSTVQGVNHTLYAKWNEIPLPKYMVSITTPSNGSISVFNGSTQIANGDQVDSATVLTLEATPNSGYRFDKWWDSNTTNPREFTLEQNLTISATFKQSVDNSYIEPADLTLKLYPNPITNGVLTVEIPESFGGVGVHTDIITIYNVSGKLMLSKPANRPKTRINISHLPNGTYIVKIGEVSAKIVKQ